MNVYYNPESFGLEKLCELNEHGLSYEYNMLVIFKDTNSNRLFYAHDSGCSCPTPFEDYYFNSADSNNLDEITINNIDGVEISITNFPCTISEKQNAIGISRTALLSLLDPDSI